MLLTRDKLAHHNRRFADHDRYAFERIHAFVQEQCQHLQDNPIEPDASHKPGPLTRIYMTKQQPKCESEGDKMTDDGEQEECVQNYTAPTACHMLEKFTSPNVQVNRLTMRTRRRGLFNYGKSSAKARMRKPGVQDLVFSETAFLGHRQQHPSKPASKRSKKPASSYMSLDAPSSKLYYMNSSHGKVEQVGNNNNTRSVHEEKYQYQEESDTGDHAQQQHEPRYSFGKTTLHYYNECDGVDDLPDYNDDGMMQSLPYQLYVAPVVPDRDIHQEQQNYEEYMRSYYHQPSQYAYEHQALPEPVDNGDYQYEYYDHEGQEDGYYYPTKQQYQHNEANDYDDYTYEYAYDGEQVNDTAKHEQQQQSAVEERWMPHSYKLVTLNDIPLVPQHAYPVRLPTPLAPYGHQKSPIDDVQTLSTGMSLSEKQDSVDKTIAFLQASTKKASQPDFGSLWKQRPLRR
ncbi:hypothetical protein K492DRAFT_207893 [Lichtheimia hyalospora FSU 10163]|nr:hypothetical protein K492DRAFT_207893 [Lichtheimia hyalospora FSU 10163]